MQIITDYRIRLARIERLRWHEYLIDFAVGLVAILMVDIAFACIAWLWVAQMSGANP